MPKLTSVRRTGGETPGCALMQAGFFLVFVVIGIQTIREGSWGGLIFLLFGLPGAIGSVIGAIGYRRFGAAVGEIAETQVGPGEDIHFTFQQKIRPGAVVNARVFLVYRERITNQGGSETQTVDRDRLVAEFPNCRKADTPADRVLINAVFQLPSRDMGLRYTWEDRLNFTLEKSWVIKVRLDTSKTSKKRGAELWKEYLVPSHPALPEMLRETNRTSVASFYDLLLIDVRPNSMLKVLNALADVTPHLDGGQRGDLYFHRTSLLREHLTPAEAESARQTLEAAGAITAIRPTSTGYVSFTELQGEPHESGRLSIPR